eukprot:3309279-Rhodomonas_salina.1
MDEYGTVVCHGSVWYWRLLRYHAMSGTDAYNGAIRSLSGTNIRHSSMVLPGSGVPRLRRGSGTASKVCCPICLRGRYHMSGTETVYAVYLPTTALPDVRHSHSYAIPSTHLARPCPVLPQLRDVRYGHSYVLHGTNVAYGAPGEEGGRKGERGEL